MTHGAVCNLRKALFYKVEVLSAVDCRTIKSVVVDVPASFYQRVAAVNEGPHWDAALTGPRSVVRLRRQR